MKERVTVLKRPLTIAVIGAGKCNPTEATIAEEVGRRIARRGATLLCGGLGGIMEAASRGASAEGGMTIGVLPGASRRDANPHVGVALATGMGHARNVIIAQSADAVIAICGAYGTLSEIAFALQAGAPVVGLDTWSFSRSGVEDPSIVRVSTAEDAVELAISLAEARRTDQAV